MDKKPVLTGQETWANCAIDRNLDRGANYISGMLAFLFRFAEDQYK